MILYAWLLLKVGERLAIYEADIDKDSGLLHHKLMRALLLSSISICLISCGTLSKQITIENSVTIENIEPRYMQESQFISIREYMTGTKDTSKKVILRSDPGVRTGFYFVLTFDTKLHRFPPGCSIIGEFYTPLSSEPKKHRFILPMQRKKTREEMIGLTGEDWPLDDRSAPSAWQFIVQDANGKIIGSKQSYLWSL